MNDPRLAVAEKIADAIMTSGFGAKATRLALLQGDQFGVVGALDARVNESDPRLPGERYLGGLCRQAIVGRIKYALEEPLPP